MSTATVSRVKSIQTPGAPKTVPTAADREQMEAEANALEAEILTGGDTEADINALGDATAPDLKAYIDAQIAKGIAAGLATQRKAQAAPDPGAELPDQSEVDAFSIKKEVLTKQGYVVPAQYPQPAGLPNSLR